MTHSGIVGRLSSGPGWTHRITLNVRGMLIQVSVSYVFRLDIYTASSQDMLTGNYIASAQIGTRNGNKYMQTLSAILEFML